MKSPTAEQWRTGSAWALLGVSAIVLTGATAAFLIRPFAAAAMTVIPFWCWLGVGFALLALSWVFRPGGGGVHPRAVLAVVGGWLIAFSAFTEEPRSLVRGIWTPRPLPSERAGEGCIRVVTLNCGGGDTGAAREVIDWSPDLVFLQEVPSLPVLHAIAAELFGTNSVVVSSLDTAILARNPMVARPVEGEIRKCITISETSIADVSNVTLGSVHLMVPPIDVTLWKPTTWRHHKEAREFQLEQLKKCLVQIPEPNRDGPMILAGDFNVPQGDRVLRPLRATMTDAFEKAGVGWGNTVENSIPVLRIDHVWVSRHFRAVSVLAVKTQHSDHRMVVADLIVRP